MTYDPQTGDLGYGLISGGGGVIGNVDFNGPTNSNSLNDMFNLFTSLQSAIRQDAIDAANRKMTAEGIAEAIHNSFAAFPGVCSVGVNVSGGGGGKVSVRGDLNTQTGFNLNGQISTTVAPGVQVRYVSGRNGEVPTLSGFSLRVGPPQIGATMGFTTDLNITSVGVNLRRGNFSAGAYAGIGSLYQCK